MLLKKLSAFFMDILEVVVFAIAIFLFVYLLILQPHKIKGSSMEPNFPDGQYLLTDKLSYRFGEPDRGDVVVFEAPGTNGEEFIKRIIALPGETVSLQDGQMYINNKLLNESYIPTSIRTNGAQFLKEETNKIVPPGNYFVLGDNRTSSSDSRVWGYITKDKITGKAWVVYWPIPDLGLVEEAVYTLN